MTQSREKTIQMVPIKLIKVVNPRVRNKRSFSQMADSIREVGLKQPVTLARREDGNEIHYDLVCGQGRLEAYMELGEESIPAIVEESDPQEALLKSLVENLARRKHSALDLLHDIAGMKKRGYTDKEIASKTGLNYHYVRDLSRLIEKGEGRLLQAVQAGQIPVTIAVEIADADDAGAQSALRQAYEKRILRGKRFLIAKNIIERRRRLGKNLPKASRRAVGLSTAAVIRSYQHEADRKRLLIRKAGVTNDRLTFVTEALRTLFADTNFVTLLRAEALDTMPRNLALRIQSKGGAST